MRIYTGGTFDLLHYGHLRFLKRCAEFGETVVSLNTDEFIKAYKGGTPIQTYEERSLALAELHFIKDIVPNIGGADSKVTILQVKPDVVAIGSDWATKDYYKQMGFTQEWLNEQGIALLYIPYTMNISTTILKQRLGNL